MIAEFKINFEKSASSYNISIHQLQLLNTYLYCDFIKSSVNTHAMASPFFNQYSLVLCLNHQISVHRVRIFFGKNVFYFTAHLKFEDFSFILLYWKFNVSNCIFKVALY